jgi:hypothetical protein
MKTIFTGKFLDLEASFKVLGVDLNKLKNKWSWSTLKQQISLHAKQQELDQAINRFAILVAGRRFGKTHYLIRGAIKDSINNPGLSSAAFPVVNLIGMPTFPMVRRVIWRKLKRLLKDCPYVEDINSSNFTIDFVGDRPSIVCLGLNDGEGERARGLKMRSARVDEAQGLKIGIVGDVLLPALIDTPGSTLLLSGTPKGKINDFFTWWQFAESDPDWSRHLYKTIDNPTLTPEDIAIMKRIMDDKTFRQECEGSFEEFEGQIYYTLDRSIHLISKYDIPSSFDRTYMGVDWGDRYPAYVIIGAKNTSLGAIYYLIHSWVNDGKRLITDREFDDMLQNAALQYNVYQTFCDPAEPSSILRLRGYEPIGLQRAVRGFNRIEEGLKVINSLIYQGKFYLSRDYEATYDRFEAYCRSVDPLGEPLPEVAPKQQDHDLDASRMVLSTLEYKNYVAAIGVQ